MHMTSTSGLIGNFGQEKVRVARAAQLKVAFATLLTPLERSPDVFSWDPI
jgi:hypothetical protein